METKEFGTMLLKFCRELGYKHVTWAGGLAANLSLSAAGF